MKIHIFKGGYDRNFCYLVVDGNEAVLIDPFTDDKIDAKLKKLKLKYIINTHSDFDHTEGNEHYHSKFGGEIINSGNNLFFGKTKIKIIKTPGHTQDSICILIDKNLFTGDTLFVGKVGGTGSEQSAKQEYDSLHKLMELPEDIIVYPGHDYGVRPTSTIGREKKENPFLQRDFKDFLLLKRNWLQYKAERGIQ